MTIAFDYARQVWIQGPAAVPIRRQQLIEELELLTGPDGAKYLAMARRRGEPVVLVVDAIRAVQNELAAL